MQDKFVGDVGDFGKYGLLRTLAGIEPRSRPGYRLGVFWYFGDDGKPHNADLRYLSKPDEFCHYDTGLFRHLLRMDETQKRTVEEVKKQRCLGRRRFLGRNAVFFSKPLPDRQERDRWLSQALDITRRSHIVLLDPDMGLATARMETQRARSREHAYLNEVRPFVKRGQTVVIYQSYWRINKDDTPETEVSKWRHERLTELHLDEHPRVVGTVARAFVVVPAARHVEHIDRRLATFVERWGEHFKHSEL